MALIIRWGRIKRVETANSINEIIDVTEEDDRELLEKLAEISKKHDAVLMACIAPYV